MAKSSANYLNSQLVVLEAREHGYDDGIALDVAGYVSETSGANLFVVRNGRLHTPPVVSSIRSVASRRLTVSTRRARSSSDRTGSSDGAPARAARLSFKSCSERSRY